MSGLDRTSHETLTGFTAACLSQRELAIAARDNPTFGRLTETGAELIDLA
jgi:hypothetical protein